MSEDIGPFSSMRPAIGPVLPGDRGSGPAMRERWCRCACCMVLVCVMVGAGMSNGWRRCA